jgi:energy-coupling factor transporter ATP-binding protein EcfA2
MLARASNGRIESRIDGRGHRAIRRKDVMPDHKTKKSSRGNGRKGGRANSASESYFLSLEVENVRCFSERQTLDLSDGNGRHARWTILLGENGTGKTTLLQLLVMFFPHLAVSRKTGAFDRTLHTELVAAFPVMAYGYAHAASLFRSGSHVEPDIRIDLLNDTSIGILSIRISGARDRTTIESDLDSVPGEPLVFPFLVAYGSGRVASHLSLDQSAFSDAFETLFVDDGRLRNAEDWLLRLDYSASKPSRSQTRQRRRLQTVQAILIGILPDVTGIRFDTSSGVMPTPRVEFETPYGWVPLKQLGHGYRTMIAWVLDFTSRMIERYPDSSDPLAEPAVVLVDEIDLHLHPRWQRDVIGFLTERFPNTQFIVTAHSPLIVQAASGANIAVLRRVGDHVVIDNHPKTIRGWRVDQVLTSDLFGLETARPPDMEELLLERKQILDKPRLTQADRKRLGAINDEIGPIAPGDSFEEAKKTMDLIERSISLIERHQGTKS